MVRFTLFLSLLPPPALQAVSDPCGVQVVEEEGRRGCKMLFYLSDLVLNLLPYHKAAQREYHCSSKNIRFIKFGGKGSLGNYNDV